MGLFKRGNRNSQGGGDQGQVQGKKVFEPNEVEVGLIAEFGSGEKIHIGFLDVKTQIVDRGVSEERCGPLWEMIRETRTQNQIPGSNGERR